MKAIRVYAKLAVVTLLLVIGFYTGISIIILLMTPLDPFTGPMAKQILSGVVPISIFVAIFSHLGSLWRQRRRANRRESK